MNKKHQQTFQFYIYIMYSMIYVYVLGEKRVQTKFTCIFRLEQDPRTRKIENDLTCNS